MNTEIKKDEHYSVRHIIMNNWTPWFRSHKTLTEYLNTKKGRDMFKPIIKRTDSYRKYYIKGEELLNVLALSDKGKLEL